MVYIHGESDPFKYTIADIYDEFQMGSKSMWEYSNRIGARANNLQRDNNIVNMYV